MSTDTNVERCKKLVSDVQGLSQVEIEEIFKIVHGNNCDYTRNNNGIFVNLAWLQDDTIEKLERYVRFCIQSKKELTKYESLCDVLNHRMIEYIDDTEPNTPIHGHGGHGGHGNAGTGIKGMCQEHETARYLHESASKVSSSLRYYLLKKRYAKQHVPPNTSITHLNKDPYILENDQDTREAIA